jgi:hypothetical protein
MTDPVFPAFIACTKCGTQCWVKNRDVYEMPEGVAGIAWAKCRRCHEDFVRFIGEPKAVAALMENWLDVH